MRGNLSPVFTPEQEAVKRQELEQQLYDVFRKYTADFTGTNGCYLYQGRDVKETKYQYLKDQTLVLALHEGIVPSDIWLTCRKKLMGNTKIQRVNLRDLLRNIPPIYKGGNFPLF